MKTANTITWTPVIRWPSATTRDLLWISLGVGFLFFVSLGARDLWNPNEPIYGRAVIEMAERGDWLIPTVNDKVFAEKPILYFWGALTASKLLGNVSELSLRLPAAVAALASALLTYLLVLPYAGRRRACLTVAFFATLFQVFWAARAVQMDILVLASTLGVLVPLTRMLDFQARTGPAFALAGLAAGLGFLAKGPVTLIVPGIVLLGYAASSRSIDRLLHRHLFLGIAVAVAVSLPWYVMLWLQGESGFLYEVLFRQNVTRFLDAWDHQQPWWYYLKYLWIDYAPWSLLLPAAWLMSARSDKEQRLHRLSWIWILGVIAFFSLSESKRAPYILPVAPAVAILASGVVERWIFGANHGSKTLLAARLALAALALILVLGGGGIVLTKPDVPFDLTLVAWALGSLLTLTGVFIVWGLVAGRRHPAAAPMAVLAGFVSLYTVAAVWALPAVDPLKSARGFSMEMNRTLEEADGTVASFQFWDWRSGYSYYGNRSIPSLKTPDDLEKYWHENLGAHVLVEGEDHEQLLALLPDAHLVQEGKIGSRRAFLYARGAVSNSTGAPDRGPQNPAKSGSTLARLTDAEFLSQATALRREQLPADVARMLLPGDQEADVEHRRILAYEVEMATSHGFETEIFVDRNGDNLVTIVKPDGEDLEQPRNFDELPEAARLSIEALLGETPLVRLQREIEWGLPVYAAKWEGLRGTQELKVLDDGRVLFIELPRDEPIPEPVLQIASGAEVEALLLDVFVARERSRPGASRAVLAAGWPLAAAAGN